MVGVLLLTLRLFVTTPTLVGVDGHPHNPFATSGREPSTFFFISDNCPVCNSYAPEIERIVKAYRGRIVFSLVYCDRGLSTKDASRHAKSFGLAGATVYVDSKATFSQWSKADITPESAVFDSQGHEAYVGRIDDKYYAFGQQHAKARIHDLRLALDAVLAGKPAPIALGKPVGCYIER